MLEANKYLSCYYISTNITYCKTKRGTVVDYISFSIILNHNPCWNLFSFLPFRHWFKTKMWIFVWKKKKKFRFLLLLFLSFFLFVCFLIPPPPPPFSYWEKKKKACLFHPTPDTFQLPTHSVILKPFHPSGSPPAFCSNVLVLNYCFPHTPKNRVNTAIYISWSFLLPFFFPYILCLYFSLEVFVIWIPSLPTPTPQT